MSLPIDLMLRYPSILPVDSQHTELKGYLPVNGIDYAIHIKQVSGKPVLKINSQLQPFEQDIAHLQSSECPNVVIFLDKLKQIITSRTSSSSRKNLSETYRHILTEYVELREFYISMHKCTISQDLSEMKILHLDGSGRVHDLVVHTDFDNTPKIFKVVQHSLPEKPDDLFESSNSLKVIYERFVGLIEKLQNFFDAMDSLDRTCWILDPEKPSSKDCYRRIGLDCNVSIIVAFDPWKDATLPDIKFLGPERLVEAFRQKVAENLVEWKPNANIADEILKLIGLSQYPGRPKNAPKEEILLCDVGECCICFSLRLNDKLPEIICQNASCEQFFHRECLRQWLVSVNAKQSFNELIGQCPNCEKQISYPL